MDTLRIIVRSNGKGILCKGNEKKTGIAILLWDKIVLKVDYKKRQLRTLYNDIKIEPTRRYNNCKYIYIYA